MMERVFYEMPSTTNSLESSHGHINSKTPRRNNFWSALNRIVTFLIKQNFNYQNKINYNYRREVRKLMHEKKNYKY